MSLRSIYIQLRMLLWRNSCRFRSTGQRLIEGLRTDSCYINIVIWTPPSVVWTEPLRGRGDHKLAEDLSRIDDDLVQIDTRNIACNVDRAPRRDRFAAKIEPGCFHAACGPVGQYRLGPADKNSTSGNAPSQLHIIGRTPSR